ncbi:DUF4345 family protein [Devosia sediminis]|uniref:DUF4345 family protein n=1 Tax=Devosia sediminis TaxID=2798801 RepID=A0A934IXY9_9HYPH|nr:DUF4345 family protein [Devosia sediminis]MBJ3784317.1 DUF4345 family protein [Devosia sediminis]
MAWGNRILLGTGATIALVLALAILVAPTAFYGSYGIALGSDIAPLNEMKAPAGAILLAAAVMAAGLFRSDWLGPALLAGGLLYLGFGVGRLLALAADGMPPASLVAAMAVELVLGAFFAAALWRQARG